METKRCTKCEVEKPITDFYRHPKGRPGYRSNCKACLTIYSRERYRRNPEKCNEIGLRWHRANREKTNKYARDYYWRNHAKELARHREWYKRHPDRDRATQAVAAAVKRGDLVRPDTCSKCGGADVGGIEAHHEDYTKPLEVVWYCVPCHAKRHWEKKKAATS
jgi:hypothetical protein